MCRLPRWPVVLTLALSGCDAKLEIKTTATGPSEVDFRIEDPSISLEGTLINWDPPSQAQRYHVIVAKDAECAEPVKEVSDLTQASATFQDLPDGEYHICVFAYVNGTKFSAKNNGLTLRVDRTPPLVNVGMGRITRVPVDLIPTVDETAVSFQWKKISGPGDLTFSDAQAKQTTVSAAVDGDFIIRLTVVDASGNVAYDELILTWDTSPPLLDVGGDVTIGVTTTLAAAVSGAMMVQWEKRSGPGTITFGSPTSATTSVTADQDGVYVLRLTATDIAGNTGYDELTFTWDTTNPTVAVGADRAEKALFTVTPTYANGDVFSWTQQSGPGTLTFGSANAAATTISADADGTYTVRLTLTNSLSGNSVFDEFQLKWDTSVPAFTSLSLANDAADTYIKNADVTANAALVSAVVGTGHEEASYKIATAAADCSSAVTYDQTVNTVPLAGALGALADGSYKVCVRLSDAAGNTPAYGASASFSLDKSVPSVSAFALANGAADSYVNAADVTADAAIVALTATGHDTAAFKVVASTVTDCSAEDYSSGTSATVPTAGGLGADGSYKVCVRLTDAAGNTPAYAISGAFTKDTTAPAFTSLALANGAANSYVNSAEVTADAALVSAVVGTGYGDASYKIAAAAADCSSAVTYDQTVNTVPLAGALSALADGSYKVCVRLSDAAGNTPAYGASAAFALDKSVPSVSAFALANGAVDTYVNAADVAANAAIVSLTGTGHDTTTFKVVASTVTDCSAEDYSSGTSATAPTAGGLGADGSYKVCVRLTDDAGNTPAYAISAAFTKDVSNPTITSFALANDVADGKLGITDAAANNDIVALTASGGSAYFEVVASTVTDCASGVTYDGTADLLPKAADVGADGTYKVCVRVVDAAGNQAFAITGALVKDVTAPPALDAFSAAPHASVAGILLNLDFPATTSDYDTVTIRQIAGATAPAAACNDGTVIHTYNSGTGFAATSADATGLTPGNVYSFRVCIVDVGGNLVSSNTATNVKASGQNVWDYGGAGSYTFDSSLVGVSGGFASLLPVDQTDDDNTVLGFSGGVYAGTRWDTNALTMNASGVASNVPMFTNFYYGVDRTGLVLLTHFNGVGYGNGSVAYDALGRNGTLSTGDTNWKTIVGRHGMALRFDGTNDIYDIPNHADLNFPGDFTLIAWIKTTSAAASQRIFSKQPLTTGDLYHLRVLSKKAQMEIRDGTSLFSVEGTSEIADGKWHQVIGQRSGSTIHLYVDGKLEASVAATAGDLTNANALSIGRYGPTVAEAFDGTIDEIAIFKRALSAAEIATLYERQTATVFPSAWADNAALSDGNVLLAHLDDASGSITDASAYGHSGTVVGALDYGQTGTVGKAVYLDGTNDSIEFAQDPAFTMTTGFSASVWINLDSYPAPGSRMIYCRESRFSLTIASSGLLTFALGVNPTPGWSTQWTTYTVPLDTWVHLAVTWSSATNSVIIYANGKQVHQQTTAGTISAANPPFSKVVLGYREDVATGAKPFHGHLDEFAIWNRQLSAREVAMLYDAQKGGYQGNSVELPAFGRQDGWLSMNGNVFLARLNEADMKDTNTVLDYSSYGATATFAAGDAGVKSVNGKLRGALDFDGTDDYVSFADAAHHQPTTALTMSAWVKWDAFASDANGHAILSKSDGTNNGFALTQATASPYDRVTARVKAVGSPIQSLTSATRLNVSQWHLVTATYDGAQLKLYVNGRLDSQLALTGNIDWGGTVQPLLLGSTYTSAGAKFNGQLDEVALWNRVLTDAEIARMYDVQASNYQSVFESRAIDVGGNGNWSSLIVTPDRPYGKALPNNGAAETGYAHYDADSIDLMDGNVLLLHFDELSGDAPDYSGNGNNSLRANMLFGVPAVFGSAWGFNGSSSYVSVAHSPTLTMSSELSFGMWVYSRGGTGALRMLMDKEGEYCLALSTTGTVQFGLGNTTPGWSWVDTGVSLPVGRWTHLLFTYSATTPAARLYIDGVSVYNNTTVAGNIVDTLPADNTLWLGKYSTTQGLQGAMDEVALWNRALSATEAKELYLRGAMKARMQVRSCDTTGCDDETWQGSDGTSGSFLSEANNTGLSPQAFTFSSFPSMAIGAGRFFQYRMLLGSNLTTDLPRVASVVVAPDHTYHRSSVAVNTGIAFSELVGFAETLSGASTGSVTYQLSRDNTNWYFHDGTTWVPAYLSSQSNTAADLNTRVTTFHTVVGTGTLYVKAFLNAPTGAEEPELDGVRVGYVP